ncbi:MAG TPA: DUF2191 domain-containing protein [Burkholderiaceae bacterium]|nr:DUF2191 domain-containing protein [Burkholderiaceae bacterium]
MAVATDTDFCILHLVRTTLNLRDDLVARAKALAAKECITLTKVIEEGLTLRLRPRKTSLAGVVKELPVSRRSGGVRSGVDGTSNRSLFDAAGAP